MPPRLLPPAAPAADEDCFSLETRRWAPDPGVRAAVRVAAGTDPEVSRLALTAGLLGDEATAAERTQSYICSDALRDVAEEERRERFSFAVARTLDLGQPGLQAALYCESTAERLAEAEAVVVEGRNYLAARSSLKDLF